MNGCASASAWRSRQWPAEGPILPTLLRLLFVVPLGFILAMAAAGLTVGIGLIVGSDPNPRIWTWLPLFAFWTAAYAGSFALLPFAVAIVFSEAFRLRSAFLWLAVGGGIGLAGYLLNDTMAGTPWSGFDLSFHLGAGFVAGIVYWLVAGRYAGIGRVASSL